jgi:hypothetical protein
VEVQVLLQLAQPRRSVMSCLYWSIWLSRLALIRLPAATDAMG